MMEFCEVIPQLMDNKTLLTEFGITSKRVLRCIVDRAPRATQEQIFEISEELEREIFRRIENGTWRQESQSQQLNVQKTLATIG